MYIIYHYQVRREIFYYSNPSFASFIRVRDTHHIAEAQVEKNARLREAFGISEYFVEGTSFDPERKAKEDLAKSIALQQELDAQKEMDRIKSSVNKKYGLVRTPSPDTRTDDENRGKDVQRKKKKKKREDDAAENDREREKDKKRKKKRKHRDS